MKLDLAKIEGLVFDLDGTLVDSRNHMLLYMRDLFAYLNRPFPETDREDFFTLDRYALEAKYFRSEDIPMVDRFRREFPYLDRLHEIEAVAGAAELLEAVAAAGHPCGLLTNRGTSTRPLLDQLGWRSYFDPILAAIDVERPKPHPEGLQRIAATWNLDPAKLLYIGDSELDQACAEAAGARFAMIELEQRSETLSRLRDELAVTLS